MQTSETSGRLRPDRPDASVADLSPGFIHWGRGLLGDSRKARWLLLSLFIVSIAVRLSQTVNNDVAWYVYSAGAWIDGGRLYRDIFFEVNPPLTLYLTAPAVYLAKFAGLFPVHVYLVYVFVLIALSLALFQRVIARLPSASPASVRGLVLAGLLALVIAPAGDFGQREHLMMILCLPFVALLAQRASGGIFGWPLAAVIGAMAGLGFAIKPHFLFVLLAIELYLLLHSRRLVACLRPETVTLAASGLLYGASLILVTPDYLTSVVPYALEVYNANYRNSLGFVLARKETFLVPLTVLLYLTIRRRQSLRELTDVFLISVVCFFAVYLVQMKGWNYQIYPVTAWLVMSFALVIAGTPGEDPAAAPVPDGARRPILSLAALAMIGIMVLKPLAFGGNNYPLTNYLRPMVQEHATGDSIYFFSSNALWLLPGLVNYRRGEPEPASAEREAMMERIERFVTEAVVSDLTRNSPALIMVDARPEKQWYSEPGFDFIAYFSVDPRFRALWSRYEKIEEVEGWQVFRRCDAACSAVRPRLLGPGESPAGQGG
jgi:hypothetical protein